MSARARKEYTPAPPLILMPAGGGLTFIPPDHPNVLMPVIQPAMTLPDSEIDAESDSFVGQSSSFDSQAHRKIPQIQTGYAQSIISGHTPFAHVGHQPPSVIPTFTPMQNAQRMGNGTLPPSSMTSRSATLPPVAKPIPSSNSSGTSNMYRHQGGRPQYAVPPTGPQPSVPGFSPFASPSTQPPTATVPPLSPFNLPNIPPSGSVQSHLDENINVQAVHSSSGHYTGGLFYQPVRHHWCYQQNQGDVEIWRPFSVLDSMHLEVAFNTCLHDSHNNTMILTNGGRHDVNVGQRLRTAVYWSHEPVPVRRCSWFYKRESDHRYIPYEEDLALLLENEYKKAMETGGWHRRLEFPGGVAIVMENANEVVQLLSSSQERWGNVQGEKMRPRVVKRGVESFATIEYGEREEVDHLVFVVPGIEDTSSNNGKSVEAFVDDLRSNALALLNSHFSQAFQSKSLNRVEFLPVMWTQAFQDRTSILNKQVERISLPSTPKLRHLTNNTLTDALFYTSPLFCQKICEMVGSEMNRMFHIFLERNESFSGDVSVAGHSLGSVILFDLLLNQRQPGDLFVHSGGDQQSSEQISPPLSYMEQDEKNINSDSLVEESANETEEVTLESLLSRIGLQDKVSLFQQEQIDVDSLIMCSEQDLKDIGLPMGPRKKLLNFLEDEKKGKYTESNEQNEGRFVEELDKKHREAGAAMGATLDACSFQDTNQHFTAKYTQTHFGAGQLKIHYPQLDFTPGALFAFGSPIAVFLSLRGVQDLGELFQLPTCPRVFNIFHPFDPVAYRLEPLIRPHVASLKPVQVPHYKGRKRLHLEFKEAVTRYGTDIKQKIVDSFKSTWNTINDFTRVYKADTKSSSIESEVQAEMNQMMSHIAQQHLDDDVASVSSAADEEINDMGHLNDGQRVDYMLQEGPLESFNDYLFALDSHSCYWESEDTALMLLKEIYSPLGFRPVMPGEDALKSPKDMHLPPRHPPPPVVSKTNCSYPISPTSSFQASGHYQTSQATFHHSAACYQGPQPSFGAPPPSQTSVGLPPPSQTSVGLPPPSQTSLGLPPPSQTSVGLLQPSHTSVGLLPPSQTLAGLPPPMFSLQSQMLHGARRSPYVVPDFSSLPPSQSHGIAGPPPIQPALPQGYRKAQH